MEKFLGFKFRRNDGSSEPNAAQGLALQNGFQDFFTFVYGRLAAATVCSTLINDISLVFDNTQFTVSLNLTTVVSKLQSAFSTNQAARTGFLFDLRDSLKSFGGWGDTALISLASYGKFCNGWVTFFACHNQHEANGWHDWK